MILEKYLYFAFHSFRILTDTDYLIKKKQEIKINRLVEKVKKV